MLETFRLAKFRFTICAREQIRFPAYKGSAFRGGFGYAFKRVVCVTKNRECDDCLLKQKCIYSYIFETPPPEDAEMLRLYPKVPHPFVIEPPFTEKQSFELGEEFSFHLILIGNAIDYLPYFIYTFTELGKLGIGQGRGKYDLLHVEGIGLEDEAIQIYNSKDQTLTNHYPIIQARQLASQDSVPVNEQGVKTYNKIKQRQATSSSISPPCEGWDFVVSAQSNDKGEVIKSDTIPLNHNNKINISIITPLRLRFDGHITDKIGYPLV